MISLFFDINYAESSTTGISVGYSTLKVENSTFNNTKFPEDASSSCNSPKYAIKGGFMSINSNSVVTVNNTRFIRGYAYAGGVILMSGESSLTIFNSSSEDACAKTDGGVIYANGFKSLDISNSTFNLNY